MAASERAMAYMAIINDLEREHHQDPVVVYNINRDLDDLRNKVTAILGKGSIEVFTVGPYGKTRLCAK